MSLAQRIPQNRKSIDARRLLTIVWCGAIGFVLLLALLYLLQRLGLPLHLMMGILGTVSIVTLVALSLTGRTMSSAPYFYAGRMAGSTALGLGGMNDWMGGAFLVLLLTLPLAGQMVLAPAVMLGIVLQTGLFTLSFQRSGVATLSGFMDWRSRSRLAGLAALAVTLTMLSLLIIAEATVLIQLVGQLVGQSGPFLVALLLVMAGLPALMGGWLSLVLVNAVLSIWMLTCLLLPAVMNGFFTGFLSRQAEIAPNTQVIPPLELAENTLPLIAMGTGLEWLSFTVTILVLACGFATLPSALSRAALASRPVAAMETNSWSALTGFLVLSAVPLSLALIAPSPNLPHLASLLRSDGLLYALPHLALALAAFNGLSVCMHTFAVALARALRRTRRLDPGEQSMFPARLFVLALMVVLYAAFTTGQINRLPESLSTPGNLLLAALSLGAGSLFMPLVFLIWGPVIVRLAGAITALAGAVTVVTLHLVLGWNMLSASLVAMGLSFGLMVFASLPALISGRQRLDLRHAQLRDPTPIS